LNPAGHLRAPPTVVRTENRRESFFWRCDGVVGRTRSFGPMFIPLGPVSLTGPDQLVNRRPNSNTNWSESIGPEYPSRFLWTTFYKGFQIRQLQRRSGRRRQKMPCMKIRLLTASMVMVFLRGIHTSMETITSARHAVPRTCIPNGGGRASTGEEKSAVLFSERGLRRIRLPLNQQ